MNDPERKKQSLRYWEGQLEENNCTSVACPLLAGAAALHISGEQEHGREGRGRRVDDAAAPPRVQFRCIVRISIVHLVFCRDHTAAGGVGIRAHGQLFQAQCRCALLAASATRSDSSERRRRTLAQPVGIQALLRERDVGMNGYDVKGLTDWLRKHGILSGSWNQPSRLLCAVHRLRVGWTGAVPRLFQFRCAGSVERRVRYRRVR